MGKGDVKSKKGKITKGTFGNSRKHRSVKAKTAPKPAPAATATPAAGTSAPATAAPPTGSAT